MAVEARHRPLFGVPDSGRGALGALHLMIDGALILLIAVVAAAGVAAHVAPLVGMETLTIRGRSMEPAIPLGSIVAVSTVDEPRLGDVITYHAGNGVMVTHRVVGTTSVGGADHLVTKGDRNAQPDANPVPLTAVLGRVDFYLPGLGFLAWMISTPSGLVGIVTTFLALLICLWLVEEVEAEQAQRSKLRRGRV